MWDSLHTQARHTQELPSRETRCGQGGGDRSLEEEELAGAAHCLDWRGVWDRAGDSRLDSQMVLFLSGDGLALHTPRAKGIGWTIPPVSGNGVTGSTFPTCPRDFF